nr:DNA-directed DNA/RNA polymerase mu-like isoform X2 [Ciona intestinalis]|eukprot:XP_002122503.1 DNA-directed DNA/RNA polymerase mu-like isoform X2 [Ciona intestinalis]
METIYFVSRRMNKARKDHLTKIANKSGFFKVTTDVREASIVISQESNREEIVEYLRKNKLITDDVTMVNDDVTKQFVDVSWFVACMKEKSLLPMEKHHKLQFKKSIEEGVSPSKKPRLDEKTRMTMYACQRTTPLVHYNQQFTDALEILEENALYRGDSNAEARALSFRRGSASLKALHHKVTHVEQLANIPYVDSTNSSKIGHCKKVIKEILEEGFSDEAEGIANSEFYKSMKIFCGIFGVGPNTERKWFYNLKMRTLEDVRKENVHLNKDQAVGFKYYEDLNEPLLLEEANHIAKLVQDTCVALRKDTTVTVVGGFRRGKTKGHDLDLMISHPIEGKEEGLLGLILDQLKEHFVYTEKKGSIKKVTTPSDSKNTMDHFEKCFSIFKFQPQWVGRSCPSGKGWTAKRVDLIVVSKSQFAFAVLGWTGTKHFEREIRRYARSEKKIVLTSHGMYDLDMKESYAAETEEDIFNKLGLKYLPPNERCC